MAWRWEKERWALVNRSFALLRVVHFRRRGLKEAFQRSVNLDAQKQWTELVWDKGK